MEGWRKKGLEQNRDSIRGSRRKLLSSGSLRSFNQDDYSTPDPNGKKQWQEKFASFTLHSAAAALGSTLVIMCIFSFIGQEAGSRLEHIGEMMVTIFWLVPDLVSIPFIAAISGGGAVISAVQMNGTNFMRHALALALSLANAFLVWHELLPLIMPS